MTRGKDDRFEHLSFGERLSSMLQLDFRRMFTSRQFYIFLVIALVTPILVLVMTSSFAGTVVEDPQTGTTSAMTAFDNAWLIIASESGAGMMSMTAAPSTDAGSAAAMAGSMGMDMTSMMNINLMYFMVGVFICLFVADDFRSGYAKNLFTVRARKGDYVTSKTIVGFTAGALFLIAFFVGSILGGSTAGLSFDLGTVTIANVVMCMLSKIFLMSVFVAIFLIMSVIAKNKSWMSILLSLGAGMLLFMMIPMMTPLNAGVMNLGMCLAGGAIFATALGAISNMILKRTALV